MTASLRPMISAVGILGSLLGRLHDVGCHDAKALQIAPTEAETYLNRGNAWWVRREYDKAITAYDKAIELKPDFAEAYYDRGLSRAEKQDYDGAMADYNRAIELKPNHAYAHSARGGLWRSRNELDKALADYKHGHRTQARRGPGVPGSRAHLAVQGGV